MISKNGKKNKYILLTLTDLPSSRELQQYSISGYKMPTTKTKRRTTKANKARRNSYHREEEGLGKNKLFM